MNGGANAPKLEQRRRVSFSEFPFDTPQLAAGRFIIKNDLMTAQMDSPLGKGLSMGDSFFIIP